MSGELYDAIVTANFLEEKRERSKDGINTELCECFLQLCPQSNECAFVPLLKVLESNFTVLKRFILEYKTVEAIPEKLREEADKTVFSSVFEKKTLDCHSMVSSERILEMQKADLETKSQKPWKRN